MKKGVMSREVININTALYPGAACTDKAWVKRDKIFCLTINIEQGCIEQGGVKVLNMEAHQQKMTV